ncbi:MAG: hypothetical protein QM528_06030 [Phycisphaerales bacterium]|nr:hypothetical protein [Phycisphaerales bacterium]
MLSIFTALYLFLLTPSFTNHWGINQSVASSILLTQDIIPIDSESISSPPANFDTLYYGVPNESNRVEVKKDNLVDMYEPQQYILGTNNKIYVLLRSIYALANQIALDTICIDQLHQLIKNQLRVDSLANDSSGYFLNCTNQVMKDFSASALAKAHNRHACIELLRAYDSLQNFIFLNQPYLLWLDTQQLWINQILLHSGILNKNNDLGIAENNFLKRASHGDEAFLIKLISQYPHASINGTLIRQVLLHNPNLLYNYCSADTVLGNILLHSADSLLNLFYTIAVAPYGRIYLPFIDALNRHTLSFDSIDAVFSGKPEPFYRLLINTQIEYAKRMQQKDTPILYDLLLSTIRLKALNFIDEMNERHNESNNTRFRIIDNMTAAELYYMAILCQNELYTSTFLNGIFPHLMAFDYRYGTNVLALVNYNLLDGWFNVCATYNLLDDFLNSKSTAYKPKELINIFLKKQLAPPFTKYKAETLVNVYSSLSDTLLSLMMLRTIEQKNMLPRNSIYSKDTAMLNLVFLTCASKYDTFENKQIQKLGVDNLYSLDYKKLADSLGRFYILEYFYGDDHEETAYNYSLKSYSSAYWTIDDTSSPYWVKIQSKRGNLVTIYANKPFNDAEGTDIIAQQLMTQYLDSINIHPKIVVHRGHSYTLKNTIELLSMNVGLILLGSCGGSHNAESLVDKVPHAQIIATQKIGVAWVNQVILNHICEALRAGTSIRWQTLWHDIEIEYQQEPGFLSQFANYIPPYENLNVLFLNLLQREK